MMYPNRKLPMMDEGWFAVFVNDPEFKSNLKKLGRFEYQDEGMDAPIIQEYWTQTRWKVVEIDGIQYVLSPAFWKDEELEARFALHCDEKFKLLVYAEKGGKGSIVGAIGCHKVLAEYDEGAPNKIEVLRLPAKDEFLVTVQNLDHYFSEKVPEFMSFDNHIIFQALEMLRGKKITSKKLLELHYEEIKATLFSLIETCEKRGEINPQVYFQLLAILNYSQEPWFLELGLRFDIYKYFSRMLDIEREEVREKVLDVLKQNVEDISSRGRQMLDEYYEEENLEIKLIVAMIRAHESIPDLQMIIDFMKSETGRRSIMPVIAMYYNTLSCHLKHKLEPYFEDVDIVRRLALMIAPRRKKKFTPAAEDLLIALLQNDKVSFEVAYTIGMFYSETSSRLKRAYLRYFKGMAWQEDLPYKVYSAPTMCKEDREDLRQMSPKYKGALIKEALDSLQKNRIGPARIAQLLRKRLLFELTKVQPFESVTLATRCSRIDHILDGGFKSGKVYEIYGDPCIRMENFLHQLACFINEPALIITSNFFLSKKVIVKISKQNGIDPETVLASLHVVEPFRLDAFKYFLFISLKKWIMQNSYRLIIIHDFFDFFWSFRREFFPTDEGVKEANEVISELKKLAVRYNLIIILNNLSVQNLGAFGVNAADVTLKFKDARKVEYKYEYTAPPLLEDETVSVIAPLGEGHGFVGQVRRTEVPEKTELICGKILGFYEPIDAEYQGFLSKGLCSHPHRGPISLTVHEAPPPDGAKKEVLKEFYLEYLEEKAHFACKAGAGYDETFNAFFRTKDEVKRKEEKAID